MTLSSSDKPCTSAMRDSVIAFLFELKGKIRLEGVSNRMLVRVSLLALDVF